MPLTEKGEKIRSAMEKEYGKEKGEKIFYASRNKGNIMGVDREKVDQLVKKIDACSARMDSLMSRRAKNDEFEDAKHPRNSGGIFIKGEGEEGKEDSQMEPGKLSKKDLL